MERNEGEREGRMEEEGRGRKVGRMETPDF